MAQVLQVAGKASMCCTWQIAGRVEGQAAQYHIGQGTGWHQISMGKEKGLDWHFQEGVVCLPERFVSTEVENIIHMIHSAQYV